MSEHPEVKLNPGQNEPPSCRQLCGLCRRGTWLACDDNCGDGQVVIDLLVGRVVHMCADCRPQRVEFTTAHREEDQQLLESLYDRNQAADKNYDYYVLDKIYDWIDDLLSRGEFERVDSILESVDISRLDTPSSLGFLTLTTRAKDRMPNRQALFERMRQDLDDKGEETAAILRGLE